ASLPSTLPGSSTLTSPCYSRSERKDRVHESLVAERLRLRFRRNSVWRALCTTCLSPIPIGRGLRDHAASLGLAEVGRGDVRTLDGYRGRFDGDWREGLSLWTQDYPRADRTLAQAVRRVTRIDARSVEQAVNLDAGEGFYNGLGF